MLPLRLTNLAHNRRYYRLLDTDSVGHYFRGIDVPGRPRHDQRPHYKHDNADHESNGGSHYSLFPTPYSLQIREYGFDHHRGRQTAEGVEMRPERENIRRHARL